MPIKSTTSQAGSSGKRVPTLLRTIVPAEVEQNAKNPQLYRVMDSDQKWYSCWVKSQAEEIAAAMDAGQTIDIAIAVEPKNGKTYYTITDVGPTAAAAVSQDSAGAPSASGQKQAEIKAEAVLKAVAPIVAAHVTQQGLSVAEAKVLLAELLAFGIDLVEGKEEPASVTSAAHDPDDDIPF